MLGLALEGGGAKGAFHFGVVKAYLEEGYQFQGIAGTSIGALNGAIIAQGDFEAGYRMWQKMNNSMLFDLEQTEMEKLINKKIDKKTFIYLTTKLKDIIENKGIDTSKIRGILDDIIDEDKLRRSPVDFAIVTVSIPDLKPLELYKEDIPKGELIAYLMASANFPVFKIQPIEGKYYIDGGFYDNCPINLLARKGYKEIIAVRTLSLGVTRKVEDNSIKVTSIVPSDGLGKILNFDKNVIESNLKMGYYDAMRVIKNLAGRKYYIKPLDDELFNYKIFNMPDDMIKEIGETLSIPEMEIRRMLFEKILPDLAKKLSLALTSTYQDIVIGIFEVLAQEKGIDRFQIYDFTDFVEIVKRNAGPGNDNTNPIVNIVTKKTKKLSTILAGNLLIIKVARKLLKVF